MRFPITLAVLCLLAAACSYYHTVQSGDTLYNLSREYGVSVSEIQQANPGVDPYNLQVGQKLKIPRFPEQQVGDFTGQYRTPKPTTPAKDATPIPKKQPPENKAESNPPAETPAPVPPAVDKAGSKFIWPLPGGKILRKYGDQAGGVVVHGMDIGAPAGSPILAVADGRVLLSSDRYKSYGNMVVVVHDNQLVSIYAYNRKNLVQKDDQVKQGQKIAEVGQTGRGESPMLHFEMRIGSRTVDPLKYLSPK